jgi:hypothetical protein
MAQIEADQVNIHLSYTLLARYILITLRLFQLGQRKSG